MFCEAVLVDADYRSRVEREVIRLVERDSLRRTIDIHTFHRSVALHDTLTGSVVSITIRLAVVREYHQAIVFIPVHLACLARAIVGYRERIPIGIVSVMVMPDLRGRRRVVAGLVQISKRIRLRHPCSNPPFAFW